MIMDKSKVFLSSTQFQDEFKTERDLLPIIFSKEPLSSIFYLYKIEDRAAGHSIDQEYIRNVKSSDLVILLLDNILREAVKNEIQEARKSKIPVFVFIKENPNRSSQVSEFIRELQIDYTTARYDSITNLMNLVEDSLLSYYSPKLNKDEESESIQRSGEFDTRGRSIKIALYSLRENSKVSTQKILSMLISEQLIDDDLTMEELCSKFPTIDGEVFRAVLEKMMRDSVVKKEGPRISLDCSVKATLTEIAKKIDKEETEIQRKLAVQYAETVKLKQKEFIEYLRKCLALVIYKTTIQVADSTSSLGDIPYDSEGLKKIILDSTISILGEKDCYAIWQKIILEILCSKDVEIINWINCLNKSYWFLAMLGYDKESAKIFEENLDNYQIFLDSHIVIRAMIKSGPDHETCEKIISLSKKLNVKLLISDSIFSEVKVAFEQADSIMDSCSGDANRAKNLFDQIGKKHDVIEAFYNERLKNKYLTWSDFLSQYYSQSNELILETYLRKILKIDIFKSDVNTIAWLDITAINEQLLQKRGKLVKKAIQNAENQEREELKQKKLRENEAKQLVLLYDLRKTNPNTWFVTYDEFIYKVCRDIFIANNQSIEYYPCFMKPNKWIELLKVSDKKNLDESIFYDTLMESAIHHVVNSDEATVITEMLKSGIDKQIEDQELLSLMFTEAINQIAIAENMQGLKGHTSSAKIRTEDEIREIIRSVVMEQLNKSSQLIHDKNEELEKTKRIAKKEHNRAKYYKKQIREMLKQPKKGK